MQHWDVDDLLLNSLRISFLRNTLQPWKIVDLLLNSLRNSLLKNTTQPRDIDSLLMNSLRKLLLRNNRPQNVRQCAAVLAVEQLVVELELEEFPGRSPAVVVLLPLDLVQLEFQEFPGRARQCCVPRNPAPAIPATLCP